MIKKILTLCILSATLLPVTFPTCPLRAQSEAETQRISRTETQHIDRAETAPRWALSSNLLSWTMLAPNLGVEIYLGGRWSVAADASYGMWGFGHTTHTTQTWSAGTEVRYWLQNRRYGFRRTHIGLSMRGGEFDENYFSDGRRGNALMAGLTVGYRFLLPGRWRVDAGLGAGLTRLDYDRYRYNPRFDSYELQGSRTRNLWGLTDLHVSLIYTFPR